jgi:hypothetical protein
VRKTLSYKFDAKMPSYRRKQQGRTQTRLQYYPSKQQFLQIFRVFRAFRGQKLCGHAEKCVILVVLGLQFSCFWYTLLVLQHFFHNSSFISVCQQGDENAQRLAI